jgi:hypothetical protein
MSYFDIVIPVGPNDSHMIKHHIQSIQKNVLGYRTIYIVTPVKYIDIEGATVIEDYFSIDEIAKYHGYHERNGWYLQQLYKIEALIESPASATIIWDSDCVPTRSIQIFNHKNDPIYMRAAENHRAYFEMIEKFLGLPIVQNQSFVIPGFPMKNHWIKEFVQFVEDKHLGKTWFEAIIQETDLSLQSGFSETETLGTWLANSYPQEWQSIDLNWERYGQSRFNYARNLSPENLVELGKKNNLDIISFENWDVRGIWQWIKFVKNFFSKIASIINILKRRKIHND